MTANEQLQQLQQALLKEEPSLRLKRDVLMAQYTSLHLGGHADMMAEPETEEQIRLLLKKSYELELPVTVIGHGSNLVVRDGGIRGLVIRVSRDFQEAYAEDGMIHAQAGTSLSTLAMTAAEASMSGLAFASGIPGTVGGGVYMNAGAYGGEMSDVVTRVEGFDKKGEPFCYTRPDMEFSYRYSRLQREDVVVTRITCQLPNGNRNEILNQMVQMNRNRAEKQPLTLPSAGSTFKRPEGYYAAALIDECGLKGHTIGGASVSEKHAGFLVNRGGTAADFIALIQYVQKVVYEQRGIQLEPEVRIIGEN